MDGLSDLHGMQLQALPGCFAGSLLSADDCQAETGHLLRPSPCSIPADCYHAIAGAAINTTRLSGSVQAALTRSSSQRALAAAQE